MAFARVPMSQGRVEPAGRVKDARLVLLVCVSATASPSASGNVTSLVNSPAPFKPFSIRITFIAKLPLSAMPCCRPLTAQPDRRGYPNDPSANHDNMMRHMRLPDAELRTQVLAVTVMTNFSQPAALETDLHQHLAPELSYFLSVCVRVVSVTIWP